MSRGTRNFFAKLTHFFKQHFGSSRSTSSSSSDNVPCITPPQPLTPPASQVQITPPSLQLPPPSVEYGERSSKPTPSTSSYHALQRPPNPTFRPPTPGQTAPSLSLGSHSSAPQPCEPAGFAGAHDFVIKDSQFIDISLERPGIEKLLKYSMPDAFHNSSARYPPPKCHLGTRNDYIAKIADWALGKSDHHEPILWMRGPFGIGKSAVAQSCAEVLQRQNKLAATLFFSRSNTDRDDPRRVFTSIAYQIATICEPFSNIINARICKDPALAQKSLSTQFEELLVDPLAQVDVVGSGIKGRIVIIDGLDECRGSPEQCEIIKIITTSALEQTTPFRWFITSRPEDPIIRTMKLPIVSHVSYQFELPVSRKIDHEILLYLTDEFKKIRESHSLAESWPSEDVVTLLVDRTAGLWIYVTTIIRFITADNSFGPKDQLEIVVQFAKSVSAKVGPDNPLAEMDLFYTLIMNQVPQKIIKVVRKILLVCPIFSLSRSTAGVLGLSEEQLQRSCTSIRSVMELQGSDFESMSFHFHHASFLDFMKDPERSKELCIHGDFLTKYRRECLDWLYKVCSHSTGSSDIIFPSEPVLFEGWDRKLYYFYNLCCFWTLCVTPNHPLDLPAAGILTKLQFRMMLRLLGSNSWAIDSEKLQCFRDNLPNELRDKIIRNDKCPTPGCTNTRDVWILGHGDSETALELNSYGHRPQLKDNQHPPSGRCFCGSQIRGEV